MTGQRLLAAGGVVGPAAFAAGWVVLGATTSGYSPVNDAISELAAMPGATGRAMAAAFVVYGAGVSLYGVALRRALPGPAWMAGAVAGLATVGAAAFPLGSDDPAHAVFAGIGYAGLAALPILAAAPLAASGRTAEARLSVATGVLSTALLLASLVGPAHGLLQRVGLTAGHLWIAASAVALLRGRRLVSL